MIRIEKYFPFLFAILAPALGVINNVYSLATVEVRIIVESYVQGVISILVIWFYNDWLLNKDNRLKRFFGEEAIIVIGNLLLISLLILQTIIYPTNNLLPFWIQFFRLCIGVFIVNVALRIIKYQRERANLKMQNLSLQTENLKFQVDLLKQQINPHFLFNSLNTLLDLVEEDQKAAVSFIRNFSRLYRSVLQSAKHDFISLEDELTFLNDYWELLKVRFKEAIALEINIDSGKNTYLIPPLSLQFLVENAVKHNQATKSDPLLIEITEVDNQLIIKNEIKLKSQPVDGEQVGLKNLQQRFTVLHKPIKYGVEGDEYNVQLPLKKV